MNISVRLEKIEKELLWESLVPSEEFKNLLRRHKEIKPNTQEGIRAYELFNAYLAGLNSAIPMLRAMGIPDSTSLKHVLDSLPEVFRTELKMVLTTRKDLKGIEERKAGSAEETGKGVSDERSFCKIAED